MDLTPSSPIRKLRAWLRQLEQDVDAAPDEHIEKLLSELEMVRAWIAVRQRKKRD